MNAVNLNELAAQLHQVALDRGWWQDRSLDSFGTVIALIHSEASEALEEFRNGHDLAEVYWAHADGTRCEDPTGVKVLGERLAKPCPLAKPEGVPIEFADIVIRVLDACAANGIDIDKAIDIKTAYNLTRPQRHGGKRV